MYFGAVSVKKAMITLHGLLSALYYYLACGLNIFTLHFYLTIASFLYLKIKNLYLIISTILIKLFTRLGIKGVVFLVTATLICFVSLVYFNWTTLTSARGSSLLSCYNVVKSNVGICLNFIRLDFSIGVGFCFYLLVVLALTVSTFYFGVNGVYQASIIAIFSF
jgi:hypothetical protein